MSEEKKLSPLIDEKARLKSMRDEILRLQNLLCSEDIADIETEYEKQKLFTDILEKVALYICLSSEDGSNELKKSKIYSIKISKDDIKNIVYGFEFEEEDERTFSLVDEKRKLVFLKCELSKKQQRIKKLESSVGVGKILLAFDKLELTHLPEGGV
jgi:hypothetical protein